MTKRFVVIGGDAAGMSAASLAKRRQPDLDIEVYDMGDYTSYGACGMPYYVSGEVPELDDLVVVTPREFEEKRKIKVFMQHRAEKLHPDQKVIEVKDLTGGRTKEVPYDELLIATGAEPILPPTVDLDIPGVFVLRTLNDAGGLREYIREHSPRQGLIIGTGYIGMEMAEALTLAGIKVTVLGRRPQVLPIFEEEISGTVAEDLARREVQVVFRAEADKVEQTPENRLKVTLSNGDI
ncbi:MAG: FAD-dependent oxidoreductase, partial [Thermodesulfobacteriota bacterium]|nr:FAD-dependent oxidoreductase [Thermodesulfobacteriota bacterium]